MALRVRSLAEASEKFARRGAAAAQDFVDGVETTPTSWARNTVAAQANYEAGVQAAIADKAFGKGVAKAGDEKWKDGVRKKGASRYAQGVGQAQSAYEEGVAPFFETLAALDPGERGPKGSEQNYQRSANVGKALHARKIALRRGGR